MKPRFTGNNADLLSQSLRVKIWRIFILKNLNKLLLAARLFTKGHRSR